MAGHGERARVDTTVSCASLNRKRAMEVDEETQPKILDGYEPDFSKVREVTALWPDTVRVNCAKGLRVSDFESYFSRFGPVLQIRKEQIHDYGFVRFVWTWDATKAFEASHELKSHDGKTIKCLKVRGWQN
mmetsp:Transcript_25958/g.64867  ORF Transcript_25958/g.64867 Transcript_25958/m.64867 type:complete len:131 (-) Transcript_25958:395-787(-)